MRKITPMSSWVASAKKLDRLLFGKRHEQFVRELTEATANCSSVLDVGRGAS